MGLVPERAGGQGARVRRPAVQETLWLRDLQG